MGQKRLLKDNEEIKLIVEKNQEIIEAMKKLSNRILDDKPKSEKTKRNCMEDADSYIIKSK
jgi:hypothetical protein